METKHTAGSWYVNAIAGNRVVGDETSTGWEKLHINSANHTIARVYRPSDARLIAAAPDLLTALRRILSAHDSRNNGAFMGEAVLCPAFAEQARAAIAKATVE